MKHIIINNNHTRCRFLMTVSIYPFCTQYYSFDLIEHETNRSFRISSVKFQNRVLKKMETRALAVCHYAIGATSKKYALVRRLVPNIMPCQFTSEHSAARPKQHDAHSYIHMRSIRLDDNFAYFFIWRDPSHTL